MGGFFQVAWAVAGRQIYKYFTNPAFLAPALFPLFFFVAFAGGLTRIGDVPGFDYAAGYIARGAAALPVFVNKEEALKVESERAILLRQLEVLEPCAPQLYRYVRTPAGGRPRGLEDLTYWAVEDFGVRPVMRVVHQAMYRAPGPDGSLAIASSQIYAAHYLDAAENFVCALVRPGSSGREFYLISVNRARTRSLSGVLRAFARSTVRGRSRDAMEKILTSTKASLEAASR